MYTKLELSGQGESKKGLESRYKHMPKNKDYQTTKSLLEICT